MIDSRSRKGGRFTSLGGAASRVGVLGEKTAVDRPDPGGGGSGWGSETGEKKAASQHNLNVTPFKQTLLTKAPEFHPPRHFLDTLK